MKKTVLLLFLLVGLTTCKEKKLDYATWVKEELAKPERIDSLFQGVYFGMPQQAFYTHCWELNKKGILLDGNGNSTARFRLEEELDYPANFQFYPGFVDGKIATMPAFVEYDGWAPWNKHLFSNKLIDDIKSLLEEWYDAAFVPIESPFNYGKAYLTIQSNRKIVLYYQNDNQVKILFTDLTTGEDIVNKILE